MCGRYALWGIDDLGGRFLVIDPMLGLRSHFNIAPGTENPVITREQDGNHIRMMQWGLILHRAKDLRKARQQMINTRAETLQVKPVFGEFLRRNRCIVPANGFYEWKMAGRRKEPFFIGLQEKVLFGIAGLCDTWQDPAGRTIATYTIITTEPNALVSPFHNRMPAILRREDEQRWLSPPSPTESDLSDLLSPYPAAEMFAYPIGPAVNSPAGDGEEIIRPQPVQKSWFD